MNKRIKKKKGLLKITAEEVWSLDITLAKYILPRLKKYKEVNTLSYPAYMGGTKEWHSIIDKMIFAFEYVLDNDLVLDYEEIKKLDKQYEEGIYLFAKYFRSLWD